MCYPTFKMGNVKCLTCVYNCEQQEKFYSCGLNFMIIWEESGVYKSEHASESHYILISCVFLFIRTESRIKQVCVRAESWDRRR